MASNILRRVGWTLIAVGLVDIGFMVYCIMNDIGYGSSLNVFALIAGVFLLRQSMKAAKIVSFFAAFMLSGLSIAAILFPLLMPFDLIVTIVRLNPVSSILTLLLSLAFFVFVLWVYRSLTSPVVMEARRLAGVGYKKPTVAFGTGIAIAVGLSIITTLVNKGPSAEKAIVKAKEATGPNYSYYVTSMQWAGDSGSAVVTAYNATEIKEVRVEW